MVYGRTGAEYPIALICPSESHIQRLAEANGIEAASRVALCKNPKIIIEVQQSLAEACKKCGLVDFEMPRKIALLPGDEDGQPAWTPENDLLTAAMKLKRPLITKAF